jgi:hypothetical protein
MKSKLSAATPPGGLILTAALMLAFTPGIRGGQDSPTAVEQPTVAPSNPAGGAQEPSVQKTPATDLTVDFDPSAGTPRPHVRPKQVPMIVVVIVWLSIVTFWYLRRTADPESPGR